MLSGGLAWPSRLRRTASQGPLAAAQQLAEADPAGWGVGWGAWPAVVRENR
jgi:hypothetical protein